MVVYDRDRTEAAQSTSCEWLPKPMNPCKCCFYCDFILTVLLVHTTSTYIIRRVFSAYGSMKSYVRYAYNIVVATIVFIFQFSASTWFYKNWSVVLVVKIIQEQYNSACRTSTYVVVRTSYTQYSYQPRTVCAAYCVLLIAE